MSLSAEEHEFSHFEYDRANGFPGLGYYLTNPDLWDEMEQVAYGIEIEMARAQGNDILQKRLEEQLSTDFKRRNRV